jgi:tetratricopeptide (TPR) repeat protein
MADTRVPRSAIILLTFLLGTVGAFPEERIDFNSFYSYPLSVGFSFENLTPYVGEKLDYNIYYGLSGIVRMPLPFAPSFQPFLRLGVNSFTTSDASVDAIYQNMQYFALAGIGWTNRFSKSFELGVDLGAGYSMTVFPKLDVLNTPPEAVRTDDLLGCLGVRVTFSPSFNFSLDFTPSLTYRYSLEPLTQFNGLIFGLQFTGNYRFGEDPDSPKASIRSIKFSELIFPPLYAAMQSYYAKKPFAKLAMTNTESFSLSDIQVSFFQAGYMDAPTKLASISSLGPGKTVEVNVLASYNAEVFSTNGDTPLNGEIRVEYNSRNRPAKQSLTVSYVLYDRTSISWDDDCKQAAFITKADTALRNYATFIRQTIKDRVNTGYSEPMQTAIAVFYALKQLGVIYQLALTSSFAQAHANPLVVDHVHLPRETLQRRAGDCSDLTALYCALLESVGIPTGFMTVPGHIYPVFGTRVRSASYRELYPDKTMTFDVKGELWIPVEVTMIGTSDFISAWRKGMEEWQAFDGDPSRRAIYFTDEAQQTYHAVGLKEEDLGLQYGETAGKIADNFRDQSEKLVDTIIDSHTRTAIDSGSKADYNKLGIVAAQLGRCDQAQKALNTALSLDRNYLSALVNLGNVFFLKQDYQDALRVFHEAEESMRGSDRKSSPLYPRILLNISRSYYELEDYEQASAYYQKTADIAPDLVGAFEYLKSGQGTTAASTRAAQSSSPQIHYAEGVE